VAYSSRPGTIDDLARGLHALISQACLKDLHNGAPRDHTARRGKSGRVLPPRVPVVVALIVLAADAALTALVWGCPDTWDRAAATVSLSPTALAGMVTTGVTLGVLVGTRSLTLAEVGFSSRRIAEALAAAAVLCGAYAIAAHVAARSPNMMSLGDGLLIGYAEELVNRVAVVGGLLAATSQLPRRRALVITVVGSAVLFAAWHIPHDLVETPDDLVGRYAGLVGHAALMAGIYLYSHNVMLVAVLHALADYVPWLGNGELSWNINGAVSVAILVMYAVASRRARAGRATPHAPSRRTPRAPSDTSGGSPSSPAC
jgi:membrane protease YdiL (CAAX protease family)